MVDGASLANMLRIFFSCFLLLFAHFSVGQHLTNTWYFSTAGLDFSSGQSKLIKSDSINNHEASSTISDSLGNFLLHSNSTRIWNKSQKLMLEKNKRLRGDVSSTQGALFVPKPGSSRLYYLFTIDNQGGGLYYSLVDTKLDTLIEKDVPLDPWVTEKMTASIHRNQRDVWVVVHKYNSDSFLSYVVTEEGVSHDPVVSSVGTVHAYDDRGANTLGQMKISPQGDQIAVAVKYQNIVEVFDFNTQTGVVSSPYSLSTARKHDWNPYGVEFSPDGSKLYVGAGNEESYYISQYDLHRSSVQEINQSEYVLNSPNRISAMQLGLDGIIYIASPLQHFLGAIATPNLSGKNCSYQPDYVYLEDRVSMFGLPNFITSYFRDLPPQLIAKPRNTCLEATFNITNLAKDQIASVSWSFGDLSPAQTIDDERRFSIEHQYVLAGTYTANANVKLKDGTGFTLTRQVSVEGLFFSLGNDTTFCGGDTLAIHLPSGLLEVELNAMGRVSDSVVYITNSGSLVVTRYNNSCYYSDTIYVKRTSPAGVFLGFDIVQCDSESIRLRPKYVGGDNLKFLWSTGSTDSVITVTQSGYYWLKAYNECKVSIDTISVTVGARPVADTLIFICEGSVYHLKQDTLNETTWQVAETKEVVSEITQPGSYIVRHISRCGEYQSAVEVKVVKEKPKLDYPTIVRSCVKGSLKK